MLLQSLAYNIDLSENLAIADYKGNDQGKRGRIFFKKDLCDLNLC